MGRYKTVRCSCGFVAVKGWKWCPECGKSLKGAIPINYSNRVKHDSR